MGRNRKKVSRREALGAALVNARYRLVKAWPWIAALLLLAGLAAGAWHGYWYLRSAARFRVARMEVVGCYRSTPKEIEALSGVRPGDAIFDKDMDQVAENIGSHPWVRSVRASRVIPDGVRIVIVEHRPAALVAMGQVYMADGDGRIFKRVAPGDDARLPVITGLSKEQYAAAGEESRDRIRQALALVGEIGREAPQMEVSEVNLDPVNGMTVFLRDGGMEVRFGRSADAAKVRVMKMVMDETSARDLRASAIYLDNEFRTDWVAVRLKQGTKSYK